MKVRGNRLGGGGGGGEGAHLGQIIHSFGGIEIGRQELGIVVTHVSLFSDRIMQFYCYEA